MPPILLAIWRVSRIFPVLIALLLLVNLGVFAWRTVWLAPEVATLERQYLDFRTRVRLAQEDPSSAAQEHWRQAAEDLERFRQGIPHRKEFTGLIAELFAMAETAGLGLDRVGYEPKVVAERDLLRYDLVFSVRGDYRQIKTFIHALEQSSRIIGIEGISLAGQESADREAVNLNIRLSTYFASDPS